MFVVPHFGSQSNRLVVPPDGHFLGPVVIFMHLRHFRTDENLVQVAYNGTPLKKEDTVDQLLRVPHLGDGPFLDRLIQLFVLPVFAHLGVDHVLLEGG